MKKVTAGELPGWSNWTLPGQQYMRPIELQAIVALVHDVKAETMIEIGVNEGFTARALLDNVKSLQRYIGIDVEQGYQFELPAQARERPSNPGWIAAPDRRFELLIRPRGSLDCTADDLPKADAIFIDGDHGKIAVEHDSLLALDLVRPGGIVIWHDYDNPETDVTDVLDMLFNEGWDINLVKDTWIAFERFF